MRHETPIVVTSSAVCVRSSDVRFRAGRGCPDLVFRKIARNSARRSLSSASTLNLSEKIGTLVAEPGIMFGEWFGRLGLTCHETSAWFVYLLPRAIFPSLRQVIFRSNSTFPARGYVPSRTPTRTTALLPSTTVVTLLVGFVSNLGLKKLPSTLQCRSIQTVPGRSSRGRW